MIDFETLFTQIEQRFNAQMASGVSGVLQFNLSDNKNFYCEIKAASCHLSEGIHSTADIQFSLAADLLLGIVAGERDPLQAFMQGSITASGDLTLAPILATLFAKTPS